MITAQQLSTYFRSQPFRPFRVHMASGETFDIRHPEMARVGTNFLMLFTFVSESPELLDRWETISLMLMERVSLLDSTAPHEGNGANG
jgi:hypothetical protein